MQTLWQDLRYGARMLFKQSGFTLIAVVTLALGIGATTAIFSVVNAVLLRPLPYAQPHELVSIYDALPAINVPRAGLSEAEFVGLRNQNQSFAEVAAWSYGEMVLRGVAEPQRVTAPWASANFFRTFGVNMALGRDFLPEEELSGKSNVVVLSHQFWRRKFGGDPAIVGRALTLDEMAYTVIGVLPADFRAPYELQIGARMDMWRGFDVNPARLRRGGQNWPTYARLRPGATLAAALAESTANTRREATAFPAFYPPDITNHIEPLARTVVGEVRQSLWILLASVAVVLLIACANVAGLLLVRGEARQKEIAVRAALGAGRGRLVRQMLAESLLLALLGGGLGLMVARWGMDGLLALSPDNLPRLSETTLDWRVMGFASLVSLFTAILCGLMPAWHATRFDLQTMLKDSGRGSQPVSRSRLRKALVVTETALAVVVLVAAGLLFRSFQALQHVNTGFRPDHLLTMTLTPPNASARTKQQAINLYDQVLARLRTLPGVTAVAATDALPLDGDSNNTIIEIEGRPLDMNRLTNMSTEFGFISEAYVQTAGVQLLRGRNFTAADQEGSLLVAVVNESLARNHWPNEDPLGKRLRLLDAPPDQATTPYLTIVGVVADVKNQSLKEAARQEVFVPMSQHALVYAATWTRTSFSLVARTANDPTTLANTLQREVRQIESGFLITQVRTMEQIMALSLVQPRFNLILLGGFALLALGLGAVGIYGVIANVVAQRTNEIGIRMALGAQAGNVLRMVLRDGMRLSGLGVGLGLLASLALTRLLRGLLFGVSATDPLTFAAIALLLTCVALLACWIPARRATKVDPLIALRCE